MIRSLNVVYLTILEERFLMNGTMSQRKAAKVLKPFELALHGPRLLEFDAGGVEMPSVPWPQVRPNLGLLRITPQGAQR